MHTLFGFQGSGSAAVEMALDQAGVEYRRVEAASWEANDALAELAAVNPLKQIPTLVLPDGSVMSESAAILIHLGLVNPGSGVLPADPSARAQAIRGLVYIAANCYSAIGVIDFPERVLAEHDEASLDNVRRGAKARLHHCWTVFADQFPLADATPGALEFLAVVVSKWSGARAHLRETRPAMFEALQRIESHPAVATVIASHWPPK